MRLSILFINFEFFDEYRVEKDNEVRVSYKFMNYYTKKWLQHSVLFKYLSFYIIAKKSAITLKLSLMSGYCIKVL